MAREIERMYGLFINTYHHCELHDLVGVSASRGDLRAYWEDVYSHLHDLLDGQEQGLAAYNETIHYVIEEIKVI